VRELQVVMSDDLIFAQTGERVPAEETVVIALDGKTRELDLTADNAKAVRETLLPFLRAGHAPGQNMPSDNSRGSTPTPSLILSRARQKAIRDWADSRGLRSADGKRPIWRTESGGYYYPHRLMKMYEAYLAAQARETDDDLLPAREAEPRYP